MLKTQSRPYASFIFILHSSFIILHSPSVPHPSPRGEGWGTLTLAWNPALMVMC